jgi:hypothetical protein
MTDAATSKLERRKRAFKVAAFILVVGPLVGVVPLLILALPRLGISSLLLTAQNLKGSAMLLMFTVMYAYIFAGIPCLIAATGLGRVTYTHGTFGWLAVVIAAITSTVLGAAVLGYLVGPNDGYRFGLVVFLVPFAIFSALVCRYLMIRIGILPPVDKASLAQH